MFSLLPFDVKLLFIITTLDLSIHVYIKMVFMLLTNTMLIRILQMMNYFCTFINLNKKTYDYRKFSN